MDSNETGVKAIRDYAAESDLNENPGVLANIRNALIYAEPERANQLFERVRGEIERSELWYQVGGVLQLAFLASLGYAGKVVRRDVDADLVVSAIRHVPWAAKS